MTARHKDASREALSRLPMLDLSELREEWRRLNKADASNHLSRDLLVRAIAYRLQELALLTPWSKDWNEKAATAPDPRGPVVRP
jgi:hypothetical protein